MEIELFEARIMLNYILHYPYVLSDSHLLIRPFMENTCCLV
jgi:hypothetical protein